MSVAEKKEFVIKHVFTDVMNMELDKHYYGETENHFNVSWRVAKYHVIPESNLPVELSVIRLECLKLRGTDDWSIETETEFKIPAIRDSSRLTKKHCYKNNSVNSNILISSLADTEKYLVNGSLTVEIHVKITKMEGIRTQKLRNFDESTKEFSDVALIVDNEKFYVSKMYLASHSLYFNSLFFGNFNESQNSDITLNGINRWDFQNFLEVIHGEPTVDDDSIDGILKLADMYDSKTAVRQCEQFLLTNSKRTMKLKFGAAVKHKMDKLKAKCFSDIKTKADVLSVIPEDSHEIDQPVWKELLCKLASFE